MAGRDINLPNLVSHLQVNLQDTSGLVADATRQGSSVGAALGQSLQQRVSAAVRDIPEVQLDANSSQLDRDLERVRRELAELSGQRIGVDVDVTRALRNLDELQPHLERLAREHPDVQVQADIGRAAANLAEIEAAARHVDDADPTVEVHTNTARASTELRQVERDTVNVAGALRGIGPALGSLAQIGAVAGAAMPAVAGLVGVLEQIAPAAAIGATAAAAVGSAVGAVALGTSGVGDAIKAAFAPATHSGGAGAAASGVNEVADAQRNLKDAVAAAALANQQAARQVASSERDLQDAERAELDAQQALVQARKDAARQLQDLNNSLVDARLAERDAVLTLGEAQDQLTKDKAAGAKVSADQLARDQLAYDKAVQALKEQQEQVRRLEVDTKAANQAGVNGSQQVRDAQQKVADTARDVSDRQQDVADAQANVARTAAQGAESIDRAREALDRAGASAGGAAGGVDKFAEAMAKLSPNAQAFVREIIKLKPAFSDLKMDVQQRLFAGLAAELDRLATGLMPVLRRSLDQSATSLNGMAKGAAEAAIKLGKDGTLGRALDGANKGLSNLVPIPGEVVTALGKLAAAAAPAFDRLTKATADKVADLSDRIAKAFDSGELTKSIDTAVGLIKEFFGIIGNVGKILTNIFAPAVKSGDNFLGVIKHLTDEMVKVSGEKGFQDALGAIFSVMGEIGRVAGPLLVQALRDIEPVFTDLKDPAGKLIDSLGQNLKPILDALAPVLDSAAKGLGALVIAMLPLLPVASQIIASLGPDLQPILDDLTRIFKEDLGPAIKQVADSLQLALGPVLDNLPALIKPMADIVARDLVVALKALSRILQDNGPELAQLGIDLANLVIAAGPLVDAITKLSTTLLVKAAPAIIAALDAATRFGTYMSGTWSGVVNNIVIPALHILTDLLNGRFAAAWDDLRTHAQGAVSSAIRALTGLPGAAAAALIPLAARIGDKATAAANRLSAPIIHGVDSAVEWVGSLPSRAMHALGDLSGYLYKSGRALIQGFIEGIKSKLDDVKGAAGSVLGKVKGLFPNSPAKEGPFSGRGWTGYSGEAVMDDWGAGMLAALPRVMSSVNRVVGAASSALGGVDFAAGIPPAGALAASYAGTAAPQQGPITINMFGTEATPAGVSAALSWRSLVGRQ